MEVVAAYETFSPRISGDDLERLLTPRPDVVTFTSSSTATNFLKLLEEKGLHNLLEKTAVASIGPITSETLRQRGLRVSIESQESTIPGLVRAIQDSFTRACEEK